MARRSAQKHPQGPLHLLDRDQVDFASPWPGSSRPEERLPRIPLVDALLSLYCCMQQETRRFSLGGLCLGVDEVFLLVPESYHHKPRFGDPLAGFRELPSDHPSHRNRLALRLLLWNPLQGSRRFFEEPRHLLLLRCVEDRIVDMLLRWNLLRTILPQPSRDERRQRNGILPANPDRGILSRNFPVGTLLPEKIGHEDLVRKQEILRLEEESGLPAPHAVGPRLHFSRSRWFVGPVPPLAKCRVGVRLLFPRRSPLRCRPFRLCLRRRRFRRRFLLRLCHRPQVREGRRLRQRSRPHCARWWHRLRRRFCSWFGPGRRGGKFGRRRRSSKSWGCFLRLCLGRNSHTRPLRSPRSTEDNRGIRTTRSGGGGLTSLRLLSTCRSWRQHNALRSPGASSDCRRRTDLPFSLPGRAAADADPEDEDDEGSRGRRTSLKGGGEVATRPKEARFVAEEDYTEEEGDPLPSSEMHHPISQPSCPNIPFYSVPLAAAFLFAPAAVPATTVVLPASVDYHCLLLQDQRFLAVRPSNFEKGPHQTLLWLRPHGPRPQHRGAAAGSGKLLAAPLQHPVSPSPQPPAPPSPFCAPAPQAVCGLPGSKLQPTPLQPPE